MAELTFTVDGALLSELGEKLVETAHIALVELVKNAHDADATLVTVKIIDDPPYGPQVHIADNGSGMTFRDVQNYWMRIATPHKQITSIRCGTVALGRVPKGLADLVAADSGHGLSFLLRLPRMIAILSRRRSHSIGSNSRRVKRSVRSSVKETVDSLGTHSPAHSYSLARVLSMNGASQDMTFSNANSLF